jgi:hypothetical protein
LMQTPRFRCFIFLYCFSRCHKASCLRIRLDPLACKPEDSSLRGFFVRLMKLLLRSALLFPRFCLRHMNRI